MNDILHEIVTKPGAREAEQLEALIRQKLAVGGPWYD